LFGSCHHPAAAVGRWRNSCSMLVCPLNKIKKEERKKEKGKSYISVIDYD
jgi:hypothetical protein